MYRGDANDMVNVTTGRHFAQLNLTLPFFCVCIYCLAYCSYFVLMSRT